MPKQKNQSSPKRDATTAHPADLRIIQQGFAGHLVALGYAKLTIGWYQARLVKTAVQLARRGRRLTGLRIGDIPGLLRLQNKPHSIKMLRAALHCWLRFRGVRSEAASSVQAEWRQWIVRYDNFLEADCGLAPDTRIYRRRYARCFLAAQFRKGPARWNEVRPDHIWRFAERFCRRVRPASANVMLCSLRSFLRFVHLQGACPSQLAQAVPHVANYGHRHATEVFSEEQRRLFLAAFDRDSPQGRRDYAMALCMIDLGLRAREVVHLRVSDVSCQPPCLTVSATKTSRVRQLPLPPHIADALRACLEHVRADAKSCDRLFLRHRSFAGKPFSLSGLRQAMRRAFHRAGLPKAWTGTHRLRHSFAGRLYERGADLKQIADVLGHQYPDTSNRYVHIGPRDIKPLAQPWPV